MPFYKGYRKGYLKGSDKFASIIRGASGMIIKNGLVFSIILGITFYFQHGPFKLFNIFSASGSFPNTSYP